MVDRREMQDLIDRYNTKNVQMFGPLRTEFAYMTFDDEGRMAGVVYARDCVSPLAAAEFFRRYLAA